MKIIHTFRYMFFNIGDVVTIDGGEEYVVEKCVCVEKDRHFILSKLNKKGKYSRFYKKITIIETNDIDKEKYNYKEMRIKTLRTMKRVEEVIVNFIDD